MHKILNSHIDGNAIMMTICAFAIPVLRYTFGIMKWTRQEIHKLDTKTRKLLTLHGFHNPKANTHRLYLHCLKGHQGITGVEDTHDNNFLALAQYVLKSFDELTTIVQEIPNPTQKFLLKFASAPKFCTQTNTDKNTTLAYQKYPYMGNYLFSEPKSLT